jgi:CMP-N,N'-diacetyllegionaminic acid synthase
MEQKILGIIPARGGSKRLPRKNIRILCGKPLIAWTIEQAKKSDYIDKLIVSTDDEEIAKISKDYGAEVPFLRPDKLARDDSPTIDAVIHAIKFLEDKGEHYDIIVLLQPTSPLRSNDDINNAIKLFSEKKPDSVISVSIIYPPIFWSFYIKNGYLDPIFDEKYLEMNHEDLPKSYTPNGAISISSVRNLLKYERFYFKKSLPYLMLFDKSIDIDTELQFKLVEEIMMQNRKG